MPGRFGAAAAGRHTALAVREVETRAWLLEHVSETAARQSLFQKAIDERDEFMFGVFLNAPAPIRDVLISPQALKAGIEQWEHNGSPEKATQVKALGDAIAKVKRIRANLVSHVRTVAKLPNPDFERRNLLVET